MEPLPAAFTNLEVTPDQATYAPGEPVKLKITLVSCVTARTNLKVRIFRGIELTWRKISNWNLVLGTNEIEVTFQPGGNNPVGYGVEVELSSDEFLSTSLLCETAFDVLSSWTVFPRYGFVCDFSPTRKNVSETIETLNHYHVNGLQFYDWQYRHDSLVPPQDEFTDPLGRPLSLIITRELISAAHRHGIKAMPYLAIYAASAAFWKSHTQWALYDQDHSLIPFGEDFLGIMNPVAGGGWSQHLLAECHKVLERLPFDGLHIDQYGDPKSGFDDQGHPVDLPEAFADFIETCVKQNPNVPVLFNAVGNWPIETLAKTPTAFNYIEIWPPKTAYTDVAEIVRNARQLSGEKPVVIALYLPANRPTNNYLADAIIYSVGGTRIELGENGRLLSDPYFPKHEAIDFDFSEHLRRQSELVIRYADWISPLIPECQAPVYYGPEGIAYFFRKTVQGYSISLVNLRASHQFQWDEAHAQPESLRNFVLEVHINEEVKQVSLVSPDRNSISPVSLGFSQLSEKVIIQVPSLEIWEVLLIETTNKSTD
jgi:dextranase